MNPAGEPLSADGPEASRLLHVEVALRRSPERPAASVCVSPMNTQWWGAWRTCRAGMKRYIVASLLAGVTIGISATIGVQMASELWHSSGSSDACVISVVNRSGTMLGDISLYVPQRDPYRADSLANYRRTKIKIYPLYETDLYFSFAIDGRGRTFDFYSVDSGKHLTFTVLDQGENVIVSRGDSDADVSLHQTEVDETEPSRSSKQTTSQ
jgi:hypothetical protein